MAHNRKLKSKTSYEHGSPVHSPVQLASGFVRCCAWTRRKTELLLKNLMAITLGHALCSMRRITKRSQLRVREDHINQPHRCNVEVVSE